MILRPSPVPRKGVVLLAVLVVVTVLSLAAYKYHDWMLSEFKAAEASVRATQARAFADSGVHYAAALLAAGPETSLNGNPWDNPGMFQGIAVPTVEGNPRTGRFSILTLATPGDEGEAFRYGVACEAAKINLNALVQWEKDSKVKELGQKMLMKVPGMTEDVANAIMDWLDADDTPRLSGAESETYSAMSPPYKCRNGPLDSLEELLLVKGVTPELLFGNDKNRNGTIDEDEGDGGMADLGWQAYLTVYSREVNVDSENQPRTYINGQDLTVLSDALEPAVGAELKTFILAYRLYGGSTSTATKLAGGDMGTIETKVQADLSGSNQKKLKKISSIWDLVGSAVTVTTGEGKSQKKITFPSPLNDESKQRELLPKVFDFLTTADTSKSLDLTPRLNVNTASEAVLQGLKEAGLGDSDIQMIVSKRPVQSSSQPPDPIYKTPAWLLTEAKIKSATLKKVESLITTRSQVYRFQSLGYYDKNGPTVRVEAVVDTNQGRPRIVYYRDLSELGRGFNVGQE